MADLIDRGASIRFISNIERDDEDRLFTFEEIKKMLWDAPAVNRWIPVEDALPELDTMVIVCYYGSDCIFPMQGETVTEAIARQNKVPTVTMGFLSEEGWNGADMFPMMVRPTFWMNLPDAPLPKPPEKE